jgi:hypothetical protein
MRRERPIADRHGGGAWTGTGVTAPDPTSRRGIARNGVVALTAFGVVAGGVTVAVAAVTTPNETHLAAVGPTSGVHGFPVWYEDDKGLRLEQCLDATLAQCDPAFLVEEGLDPEVQPHVGAGPADSNFPGESFYYQALNSYDLPGVSPSMRMRSRPKVTWSPLRTSSLAKVASRADTKSTWPPPGRS